MKLKFTAWCFLNRYHGDKNFYLALCNALNADVRFLEPNIAGLVNGVIDPFKLIPQGPYPDIAVSATTEIGTFALRAIKIKSPKTVTVNFFKPRGSWKHLDFICTPPLPAEYFKLASFEKAKLFETVGVLTPITSSVLQKERGQGLTSEKSLAVLVGGPRNRDEESVRRFQIYTLSDAHTKDLCAKTAAFAKRCGLPIRLATSPRTSRPMTEELKNTFSPLPHCEMWTWEERDVTPNPYLKYLANAQAIITTADSMSMISDACATNQPVYVYGMEEALKENARRGFFEGLLSANRIRPLDFNSTLYTPPSEPYNEALRLAETVKNRFYSL